MQSIDIEDAKQAWYKMAGSKQCENTWCLFAEGESANKRILQVVGTGKGSGMRSVVSKIKKSIKEGVPAWGGFRVDAVDDRLNAKAVCPRFVGFQLIPETCTFKQLSKILEIKGVVTTKVMTNLALMFDCESWQELNDATAIAKRLRSTCAHVPTLYDFGGAIRRRTSVAERDGLPTGRTCLNVELAQEAWNDIVDDKEDNSYVLFTLNGQFLKVLASGSGPGLAGCKNAADEAVKEQIPFWGGYRVCAMDTQGEKSSVRTKFVGFQVIPGGTPPMSTKNVSIVKPMIQSRVMPHLSCFIEAETVAEICDPAVIANKLNICGGSDAANSYDFVVPESATARSDKVKEDASSHEATVAHLDTEEEIQLKEAELVSPLSDEVIACELEQEESSKDACADRADFVERDPVERLSDLTPSGSETPAKQTLDALEAGVETHDAPAA